MRFCMVTTFYPPYSFGGDGIYVQALARALADRGHDVDVVHCVDAYRLGGREPDVECDETGIRLHRLRSRFGFLSPLLTQQTGRPVLKTRALAAVLQQGFDVIHYHNISLVGGPAVLGMGEASLRLYTPHDYWPLCTTHVFWKNRSRACDGPRCVRCALRSGVPPQLWRATDLMRHSFEKVDRILAPSRHCARRYATAALGPAVDILPLFADISPPAVPEPGGYFLYVGRLEPLKGVADLLQRFRDLDAPLWLAGDGSLAGNAASAANVRLLGRVERDALGPLIGGAIAVVAPSRVPETFGLSVVEALACGTPVLVSDRGALPELVTDTGAGFVCRNAAEFRTAALRLRGDPALRDRLGARGRQAFEREFTLDTHIARYLALVEDLLRRRAA